MEREQRVEETVGLDILAELDRHIEMKASALLNTPYPDEDPCVQRLGIELEALRKFRDWVTPREPRGTARDGKPLASFETGG